MTRNPIPHIRLGLRENWQQFTLLVVVNISVGAMVGLERTVVPLLAAKDFGMVSSTVILSFFDQFRRGQGDYQSLCRHPGR